MSKKKTLSVCMVLKNEGKTIYRCLDSIYKTGIVDEWVIGIDRSCTDNTKKEVVRFYDDHNKIDMNLYDYDWNDSFSEARNIGMDKAKGDFILIMDGHEFFPDRFYNITERKVIDVHLCLGEIKKQMQKEDFDTAYFHLYQQPFIGNTPNNYFMQPRIYRNGYSRKEEYKDKKLRFGRAAHNVINFSDPDKDIHYPEVMILHDAPDENRAERKIQRLKMNEEQLLNDIKKKPNDLRAMFYLGNTYLEAGKHKESLKWFTKYVKTNKNVTNEKYQAYMHKALCEKALDKIDDAIESLHLAIAVTPNRRDAFMLLGDFYYEKENDDKAIFYYEHCIMIKPSNSRMFCNGPANSWMPYQNISRSYARKGMMAEAVASLKRALNFMPDNEGWIEQIKKWAGDKMKVLIVDHIGSFTKDLEEYLKANNCEVVRVKEYSKTLGLWADRIWVEWADYNATLIEHPQKTIIRVHGYEAYANAEIFNKIKWECKAVVFVADHIMNKMKNLVPSLNGQCKLIHNGVDLNKFYIKNEKRDEKNVGITGLLNVKKNPMRLAKIIKDNPDMVFNLRVEWQDPFLKDAFEYETKDCENIVYHGRYDDLNEFWNQMTYCISTSDIESFSYNIAEGMAAGCTPIIYDWLGSRDIWRDDFIFNDEPVFEKKDPKEMREYIEENYNLEDSLNQMVGVLH